MKLSLEPGQNEAIPYVIQLQTTSLISTLDHVYNIPVFVHKYGYHVELCGFRIENNQPDGLLLLVEKFLPSLVNFARFPTYMFIARSSRKIYPVYTVAHEVFATVPGGPMFRHVELAKVRTYLMSYLHETGDLALSGKREKLHVRGVSERDLSLVRPVMYLKKRPSEVGEEAFWAPVFETAETLYTYAANARREVHIEQGQGVFHLQAMVAEALIADKRLNNPLELRADRLAAKYWHLVKPTLEPLPLVLTGQNISFPLYQTGTYVLAMEYRSGEERYSFYLGRDVTDLQTQAAHDLVRRGVINQVNALNLVEIKTEGK